MSLDHIITHTKELIRFRTVRSREDFLGQITQCMVSVCNAFHNSICLDRAEDYVVDESCPITIASFYESREPDLLLIGHIDVVEGDDAQFHPYEQHGRIYGRGAKDMKSGVAAMIAIMNHYTEAERKPNIAAVIVSDEESGGMNGANLIVNNMGYRPKLVISPDPGERHGIVHKEKGVLWAVITVRGTSSHASRPWRGDCAYTKAFAICQDIQRTFNLSQCEDDWRTTANVTQMYKLIPDEDGNGDPVPDPTNAIAGMVKCRIDFRFTENEEVETLQDQIRRLIEKHGAEHSVEFPAVGAVCYTPIDHPLLRNFKAITDKVEGADVPCIASAGASDLRFFSERNLPCITYGPQGANHHGKGEYVDIASIETFYQVVTGYIDEYSRHYRK